MADDDSNLTLLQVVRNNQELYMKQQWKVTYFTFLLYGAIIATFKIVGEGKNLSFILIAVLAITTIAIIWKLESSIKEHRKMAEDIYDSYPSMRKIVGDRPPPPKKVSMGLIPLILILNIIFGCILAITAITYMPTEIDRKVVLRINKLEQKVNHHTDILEEIKVEKKAYNSIGQQIDAVSKQLGQKIDQLKKTSGNDRCIS